MDVQTTIPTNLSSIATPAAGAAGLALLAAPKLDDQGSEDAGPAHDFYGQLARAGTGPTRDQQAHQAAEDFVAASFVEPLLAEARRDPFKVAMFHGGQGEEAFGQQLDVILSGRVVHNTKMPIVDSIYRNITRSQSAKSAGAATDKAGSGALSVSSKAAQALTNSQNVARQWHPIAKPSATGNIDIHG